MAATASTITNNVAVECGLYLGGDPYTSSDDNATLLKTLLVSAGKELLRSRDWAWATKEATITGDGTTTDFPVPADFERFINETGWNRTGDLPFSDPVNPRDWQTLKASGAVVSVSILWRYQGGKVKFYTAPANGADIRYEYLSSYWANTADDVVATLAYPTLGTHYVILDEPAITRLLKVKWLQAKGLDSTAALGEFQEAYASACAKEPSPTLELARPFSYPRFPNVPDTEYGL